MLKQITIGIAVFAALATPGLAQRYDPGAGSGNLVQGPGGPPVTPNTPAYLGQKNGEAYNYDRHTRATTGQAIRHHRHNKTHHRENQ
jgi:hypothetical protein